MKLIIEQPEQQEEKTEPVIKLKLEYDGDDVDLVAILKDDEEIHILAIIPDGRLHRCGGISKNSGFMVNNYGKIIERK